jgi:hypothetical protein
MNTDPETHPRSASSTPAQERHHPVWGPVGLMVSMLGPAAIGVIGLIVLGPGAIYLASAIVWGVVATVAFTLFRLAGKAMGMTRMDLHDLLGSNVARPGSTASQVAGAVMHHINGALLAIFGVYGIALVGAEVTWLTGAIWGLVLTAFALLMLTTIGSIHPAIRRGVQDDPGMAATNFGPMTPMGSLLGHVVYGLVLGAGYANPPLG